MDALSQTLAKTQQINQMRQQFSENSGKFFLMKAGILPNSGVGLPSGGASLRSTGISFPGNEYKHFQLQLRLQLKMTVMTKRLHNEHLKLHRNCCCQK